MPIDIRGFDFGRGATQEGAAFANLLGAGQQVQARDIALQQQRAQIDREAQVRQALSGVTEFAPQTQQTAGLGGALAQQPQPIKTQEEKIRLAQEIDPAIANRMIKDMGLDSASKRAEMSRFASELEATPFDMRREKIEARSQKLRAEGRDSTQTDKLLDLDEATQNQGLLGIQLADLSTKERLGFKATQAKIKAKREADIKLGGPEVKSSKILDDGTTIQSMKDGTTQVISSAGEVLVGDIRSEAIKKAQTFAVELQGKRAQEREGGKGAAKIALNAFDQVGKIRGNINDLQEGIRLVREEGAETGPIADRLPSFRAGTKKLENLRARLGLNVVGAVTFGALSEGELGLALDVALPKGLNEEQTVAWMEDRVKAQQKLADNLEEAALFLSEPGNSVADFIRFTKQRDKEQKVEVQETVTPEGAQTTVTATQETAITPTGRTATNPQTGQRAQEMSDGTWRVM